MPVFLSYNQTTLPPIPHSQPPAPPMLRRAKPCLDSLYAVSKLFGENLGRYYATAYGLQVVALRIGVTFQADDPTARKGQPSEDYIRAMFLSKRDCVQAFAKALAF